MNKVRRELSFNEYNIQLFLLHPTTKCGGARRRETGHNPY
jgi:hypothetical protein